MRLVELLRRLFAYLYCYDITVEQGERMYLDMIQRYLRGRVCKGEGEAICENLAGVRMPEWEPSGGVERDHMLMVYQCAMIFDTPRRELMSRILGELQIQGYGFEYEDICPGVDVCFEEELGLYEGMYEGMDSEWQRDRVWVEVEKGDMEVDGWGDAKVEKVDGWCVEYLSENVMA